MPRRSCANYLNQEAIDAALQKSNERMMKLDRSLGVKKPEPLYILGTCCCIQCGFGGGLETDNIMIALEAATGAPIKRVCYRDPALH